MAKLIPKVDVESIKGKSKRNVARALVDGLPNNCIVYHSYPWLKVERNIEETIF